MAITPEHQVIIRPCEEADLAAVAALYRAWEAEDITWGLRADDEDALRAKLSPLFLVAEAEADHADQEVAQLVGFVTAQLRHAAPGDFAIFPTGADYLEVEDLYVAAAWRDTGIGTHLMEHLFAVAERHRIQASLVFTATKDLPRILRFYERFGYEPWGVQLFKR